MVETYDFNYFLQGNLPPFIQLITCLCLWQLSNKLASFVEIFLNPKVMSTTPHISVLGPRSSWSLPHLPPVLPLTYRSSGRGEQPGNQDVSSAHCTTVAPSRNTQCFPTCETTQLISGHFLELWVVPGPGERKLNKIQCLVWLECGWEKHKKTKLLTLTHITLYSHKKHRSIWDDFLKIWPWEGHAKGPKDK